MMIKLARPPTDIEIARAYGTARLLTLDHINSEMHARLYAVIALGFAFNTDGNRALIARKVGIHDSNLISVYRSGFFHGSHHLPKWWSTDDMLQVAEALLRDDAPQAPLFHVDRDYRQPRGARPCGTRRVHRKKVFVPIYDCVLPSEVGNLKRGERVVYHSGYLARDINHDPALQMMMAAVRKLADAHKVHLLQKRVDDFQYDYIAVGR